MTTLHASQLPMRSSPVGTRIPGSVHSVTCSIPTMRDVIGYEEKESATMEVIRSGYPRFVTHFYIRRIAEVWSERLGLEDRQFFLVASENAALEAQAFGNDPATDIEEEEGLWGIHLPSNSRAVARIKAFLQNTGGGISSRFAEKYLLDRGLITSAHPEELAEAETSESDIRRDVGNLFGASAEHVILGGSGMNCFYSVFRAINARQEKRGRNDWIQFGWLYVDTIEILRKLTGGEYHFLHKVLDLDRLDRLLQDRGNRIAGIVTEAPTNPLIQTPDLFRLRELANHYEIPLVVDPTLASPYNIDVLPLCDVVINSLTKYAAHQGDVMMGAAVFNPASPWASLRESIAPWLVAPFSGDMRRLAFQIRDYRPVVDKINANTMALTAALEKHPQVEKVFGAYVGEPGSNYSRLERRPNSPGGLITIKLRKPVGEFYDRVDLAKGPSFGTVFTILCPFLYLAHYDLVSTEEGRRYLNTHDLDAELLRISVGVEDVDRIIAAFEEAL